MLKELHLSRDQISSRASIDQGLEAKTLTIDVVEKQEDQWICSLMQ